MNLANSIVNGYDKVFERIRAQQTARFTGAALNFRAGAASALEHNVFLAFRHHTDKRIGAFELADFHRW